MIPYRDGVPIRNQNYPHPVTIYITDSQLDFLEKECHKLGMKRGAYIRDLIERELSEYESHLNK